MADRVRVAVPQYRNDGKPPGLLPANSREILQSLTEHFADNPKVRILSETAEPQRSREFKRCRVQQFQAVIDKSGNVFPCPQVAVQPYRHLCYGNIRERRFSELLVAEQRRRLFDMDVDTEMGCRICDRKDEAVNTALHNMASAYE
jgi:radical SAM protein with 4Fe4S-binding SPASM domain